MSSRRKELEASWSRTRANLEKAFAQLPSFPRDGEEGGSVQRYREWLDHNELELALDELELLGEANDAGKLFWESMLRTATGMNLNAHAARYREKVRG
ncbi:MAG: hypothetical protein R3268_01875 [Acidiferrobacterales bacterium]|nr:hypothetical protein [Acidiferrobacterales bacterium]